LCRKANTDYQKSRYKKSVEALYEANVNKQRPEPKTVIKPDRFGNMVEFVFTNVCPGVDGKACPKNAYLRGAYPICHICRSLSSQVWNGTVPAKKAKEHLRELSEMGIGRRAVRDATDISDTVLQKIINGKKKKIRAQTERKILQVGEDARADGSLIPAEETQELLREMHQWGIPKGHISLRLGNKVPALQYKHKFVLASTALKVKKLHAVIRQELREEQEISKELMYLCTQCGEVHSPDQRRIRLFNMLPATTDSIRERWDHVYGENNESKYRMLLRDLKDIGATKDSNDEWQPPSAEWVYRQEMDREEEEYAERIRMASRTTGSGLRRKRT
jgi:hypothetical protein